jgi:hypothetical protein
MAVARAAELLASGRAIAYLLKSRVTEPTVDRSRTDARDRTAEVGLGQLAVDLAVT